MIYKRTTRRGRVAFTGTHQDLKVVSSWVQSFMHLAYGPEEGEKRYRKVRLVDALELWNRSQVNE